MNSLLKLEKINKIYTSSSNVSIGLKNINLELYQGEFVTVTGSSGSGKTTLLNVISGMDTFEEGELYFNGNPTSHYTQKEWEEYRHSNISFIFQDYNILESFTVLENVEFALLNIENLKDRRKKALELIDKVGLSSHINHRGSKLSGGQKQRTVIARALAKDSPIILADEPTGNLDVQSAKEIVSLLKEISKDKLVVVVTHNAEQFEDVSTRKIKLNDGQIVSNEEVVKIEKKQYVPVKQLELKNQIKSGIVLGLKRFKAKPKLTVFMTIMMFFAIIGTFVITASQVSSIRLKGNIFTPSEGRVVVTKIDKSPISNEDIKSIAENNDYLIEDCNLDNFVTLKEKGAETNYDTYSHLYYPNYGYQGSLDKGRYPETINEVVLIAPISDKKLVDNWLNKEILCGKYKVVCVGYKYFIDNTKNPYIYFTKDGYVSYAKCSKALGASYNPNDILINSTSAIASNEIIVNNAWSINKTYIGEILLDENLNKGEVKVYTPHNKQLNFTKITLILENRSYDFTPIDIQHVETISDYYNAIYVSREDLMEIYDILYGQFDYQASIFYKNDKIAKQKTEELREKGYIAVRSTETIKSTNLSDYIEAIMAVILWAVIIIFFTAFVLLCTRRSVDSTKADMAIFRSIGINKKVIKMSTFVHLLLCAIISYIVMVITMIVIYSIPVLNDLIPYLHFGSYLLIILVEIIMVTWIAYKFNNRLFNESVRKNLRREA